MMLAPIAHKLFDELDLWLTPFQVYPVLSLCHRLTTIDPQDRGNVVPNAYSVNLAQPVWSKFFKKPVTFRTHPLPNGGVIEPPSPQMLALHAACAQIAHMSGAVEHLVETFRDTESIPVLTAAPNSANELVHALKKVQLQQLTRPVQI